MKKITKKLVMLAAEYLGPWLFSLYSLTLRIRLVGEDNVAPLLEKGDNVIFAFWHGRMFALIHKHRKYNIQVLVSRHRDGEIAARIIKRLGYSVARGSSTEGGSQGLLELRTSLAQKCNYAFTPDGPHGPREKLKPGVVFFAQNSGLPIIPVSTAVKKYYRLKTWDRHFVPKPFSRVIVIYGPPVYIPKKLDETSRTAIIQNLENNIKDLARKAEQMVQA